MLARGYVLVQLFRDYFGDSPGEPRTYRLSLSAYPDPCVFFRTVDEVESNIAV